jgi:N-acetylmuramoyl-L-alanine amidase
VVFGLVIGVAAFVVPVPGGSTPWQEEMGPADYQGLESLAGRVTAEQLDDALAIIDPQGLLRPFLVQSADALAIRARPEATDPLVSVPLATVPMVVSRPESLTGMRILIDPGHFGGAWSEIENRHQQLDDRTPVREGDLNWATARQLQNRLESAGAQTTLTRAAAPTAPFPAGLDPSFDPAREVALLLTEQIREPPVSTYAALYPALLGRLLLARHQETYIRDSLFELYNRYDLRRRAAMAAEWADLTLSIHYNTTGPRRDNWVLAFVPGNLLPGEADTLSQRYWAIRRALAGDLDETIAVASEIMRAMKRRLALKSLDPDVLRPDLPHKKIPVQRELGVFARNLAMLKRTSGPVVLVEGPCVDNVAEYGRLQDRSVWVDGRAYPERTRQYADAVVEGLQRWVGRSAALPPGERSRVAQPVTSVNQSLRNRRINR